MMILFSALFREQEELRPLFELSCRSMRFRQLAPLKPGPWPLFDSLSDFREFPGGFPSGDLLAGRKSSFECPSLWMDGQIIPVVSHDQQCQ